MSPSESAALRKVVDDLASKLHRYQGRSIGEQNTKASFIEPIIEALGWDIRDLDEVHREYKRKPSDKPVDYALQLLRKPRLFIEAKGLGENLSDRKWVSQILGYATVAGVSWCVLTDGDEYRFFNASAPVDADEKLFCRFKISEGPIEVLSNTLELISRSNLEGKMLDSFWSAHFVDRRVKEVVVEMFHSADKALVRIIHKSRPELTVREIADSLLRLDLQIQSPPTGQASRSSSPNASSDKRSKKASRPKREQGGRKDFGVTLQQLIDSKALATPLPLFRKYKGKIMEATLNADGSVTFQGKRFKTCSTAAETARSVITGRRMNTNGWSFWQYTDANGKKVTLFDARRTYIEKNGR